MADAASSEERSPAERMAMLADLLAMIDCTCAHVQEHERRRRLAIADLVHRGPEAWWSNLRAEAQPEFSCMS